MSRKIQVNVRLTLGGRELLDRLRAHYAAKLNLPEMSQADLLDKLLRDDAQREGVTIGERRNRRRGDR